MQVHLLSGEDAGKLQTDMAEAEYRDGRDGTDRFEQHGDFASAALDAVFGRDLVAQRDGEQPGLALALGEHLARQVDGRRLEIAATDGAEEPIR